MSEHEQSEYNDCAECNYEAWPCNASVIAALQAENERLRAQLAVSEQRAAAAAGILAWGVGMDTDELLAAADEHGIAVFISDDGDAAIWAGDDAPYDLIRALMHRAAAKGFVKP